MTGAVKGGRTMAYPFRNLIFEGGGVKGIAYLGALEELNKRGIMEDIKRVGGASAGAINAVLLALDYSHAEMQGILFGMTFRNFMDSDWGICRDTVRLIHKFGWYKGDFFTEWIGDLIQKKAGNGKATFNDLRNMGFRDLYIIGTNLSTGFAEVFSYEHTPRMRVVDAVRISMSIPLFFAAVPTFAGDLYVDGGLLENYPVKLFDREKYLDPEERLLHAAHPEYYKSANREKPSTSSLYVYNKETLGFRLDTKQEIAVFRDGAMPQRVKIDDLFDYSVALFKAVLNVQENQHLHKDDWHRTIYINTLDIKTTDFDLTDSKKKDLIEQGRIGVKTYFTWYDTPPLDDKPLNRVEA